MPLSQIHTLWISYRKHFAKVEHKGFHFHHANASPVFEIQEHSDPVKPSSSNIHIFHFTSAEIQAEFGLKCMEFRCYYQLC